MSGDRPQNAADLEVRPIARDHAGSYGSWDRVFVCFGRGAPDLTNVRVFRRSAQQFAAALNAPGGFVLVLRKASTPTAEARRSTVDVFSALVAGGIRTIAVVLEAEGFVAASQRSIATAFLLTTVRGSEVKVFKHVRDATSWLAPRVYADSDYRDMKHLATSILRFIETEEKRRE